MRQFISLAVLALSLTGLFATPAVAAEALTALTVVVQDMNGEPIPRASITISRIKSKPGAAKLKVRGEGLQMRTSMQGTAPLPPIRRGRYVVRVTSPGYKTHGSADLVLSEVEQTLTITLEPPKKQVSVHKQP
jgi:hypothetical protein